MDLDIFSMSDRELCDLCMDGMNDLGIIKSLSIDKNKLYKFIIEIAELYHNNPYHNWRHGFSVFSCVYSFLKKTEMYHKLSLIDIFALCIASIAHDVDHPGNTNDFEINMNSELAIKYNDISVLENHHCNVLFMTLCNKDYGCHFISHFNIENQRKFRKKIILAILATDMKYHFDICLDLDKTNPFDARLIDYESNNNENVNENNETKEKQGSKIDNENHIQFILNVFIHSADLSAQIQPWELALKWSECIRQEFINQVKKENKNQIPISKFMEHMDDNEIFWKLQLGFIDFILKPLWKQIARLYPSLGPYYFQLLFNRDEIKKQHEFCQSQKFKHGRVSMADQKITKKTSNNESFETRKRSQSWGASANINITND